MGVFHKLQNCVSKVHRVIVNASGSFHQVVNATKGKEQFTGDISLERCDKISDTMQFLKKIQTDDRNYGSNMLIDYGNIENEDENDDNDDNDDDDDDNDDDNGPAKSMTDALKSESTSSSIIPYIKYQPVQGNGNKALPNFYPSVKSLKKVYHCVICGRQFIERRALRRHTLRDHGIVLPDLSDAVSYM